MTYQLIYSSESTTPMQADELEDLLEHARRSNGARGVTGALIYAERMFLQILEGEKPEIDGLMLKIGNDVRHERLTVLQAGDTASPSFGSWTMAYVSATREQVAQWAGVGTDIDTDAAAQENGPEVQRASQLVQDIVALLVSQGHRRATGLE